VLLWPNEGREAELVAYEDQVLELIPEHGGRVIQRVRTKGSAGGEHEPFEIHLIEFPTEDAFTAYLDDDRRAALADARDHAIARTELLRVDLV
jgi:uncharacterized protein (DUF1330 family)